jgi:hypothetical protein
MMFSTQERIEKDRRKVRYPKVIECVQGHYESEKVPFGRVYRWCTEYVVAECGCGQRVALASSTSSCAGCSTDYTVTLQEWLPAERVAGADERLLHPWRLMRDGEGESLPC